MNKQFILLVFAAILFSGLTFASALTLSTGVNVNVNVSSDQAKDVVKAKLNIDDCSNCSVTLGESNVNGEARASYSVKTTKSFKIFGLFRTNADIITNVDAQSGAVISVNRPWWAFLASESNFNAQASENANANAQANANDNSAINGEWCTGNYANDIYAQTGTGNSNYKVVEAKALGFENYKGKTACHVRVKVEFSAGGQSGTSETNVYSYTMSKSKNNLNAWIISSTSVSGQTFTYEYEWENGVCVGGNGCALQQK